MANEIGEKMGEKAKEAAEKKTELKIAERDLTITLKGNVERNSKFVDEIAEYDGQITQGKYFDRAVLNFRLSLSKGQSGVYNERQPGTIEINVCIGAGMSDESSEDVKAPNVLYFTYEPKYGGTAGRIRMRIKIDDDLNDELYKCLETLAIHTQEKDAESANIAAKDALMKVVKVIRDKRKEGVTDKLEKANDHEMSNLLTVNTICRDILQALEPC